MKRQHRRPSRSLLLLAIRYTEQRDNGLFYYQRAVPSDLRGRLPTKIIKVPLGTTDPAVALKKVKLLNAKHERQWDLLRADPNASAEAAEVQALHLLLEHGLTPHAPSQDEAALDALLRPFEAAERLTRTTVTRRIGKLIHGPTWGRWKWPPSICSSRRRTSSRMPWRCICGRTRRATTKTAGRRSKAP